MTKRKNRTYTSEFKQEAVALVTEQGYSVPKAAASLGITDKLLYNWKAIIWDFEVVFAFFGYFYRYSHGLVTP
ncbi:hypothetical protein GCM10009332_14830 [Shewanella gelidii]|uniref:Transposase n=1 Tax=Shewanella gelidii TaxID=1642821 RepID=A0A917JNL1_9GAMM|nr:hypothetical protein GCM10009332_14830 [Shewanella gelidii]